MNVKSFFVSFLFVKNQCYLAYKDGMGILIDPAWKYHLIDDFLTENGIVLKAVLLTHSHIDHTNLAQKFARQHQVPVFMSGMEIDTYEFDCLSLTRVDHLQEIKVGDFRITPLLTPGHTAGSVCYLIGRHLFSGDTVFIEGVGICKG